LENRFVYASILGIFLVVIITVAGIFAQAQPTTPPSTQSSNVINYSNGAVVGLQLPPGVPAHPVNLRIALSHIDNKSNYGGPDVMQISLWVPTMNTYVPVAILSTNTNTSAITWIKTVVNGTPVWTPPALQNYFAPTSSQLQVKINNSMVIANLTTSFNVTLPDSFGGNFTVPAMTLMFVPIAAGFAHNETKIVPSSNWTINSMHTDVPAWVRVNIPTWLGPSPVETAGTIVLNETTTYIPPKT
jgi:hypothetical protein